MKRQESQPQTISVEIDGKTYTGRYSVSGKVVSVSGAFGSKSTQVGNSPADVVARMLLRELVRERMD